MKAMFFNFKECDYFILKNDKNKFVVVAETTEKVVVGKCNYLSSALSLVLVHHRDNRFTPNRIVLPNIMCKIKPLIDVEGFDEYVNV